MTRFIEATYYRKARKMAPWACTIAKAEGGYMAFEYADDYATWRKQI